MEGDFSMSKVFEHANKVIKAYHNQLQPLCKQTDLPPLALDILLFIANNPEKATAKEICFIRGIKTGIASVHIERLVQNGLLERAVVAGDRRKNKLASTPKAAEIIEKGRVIQKSFAERLGSGISPSDMNVLKSVLETMDRNLEKMAKE